MCWTYKGQHSMSGLQTYRQFQREWCFTDGSWKEWTFSGQGWYSTLERFDGLMGKKNVRASLSPLHTEMEALLWAIECMELASVSSHVCNRLFSIGEDGFRTRRMVSFCKLFGRRQDPAKKFSQLRDYSCTTNARFEGAYSSTKC